MGRAAAFDPRPPDAWLPGSFYSAPEFSWKFELAPAGIGFLESKALGGDYRNDLFVGAARVFLEGGALFSVRAAGEPGASSSPTLGSWTASRTGRTSGR
jgi:glucose/arabinose dehydrogenase